MSLYHSLELDVILEQIEHKCQTDLGRERIRNLRPSFAPLKIRLENGRLKETMQACEAKGVLSLSGMQDISSILDASKRGRILTIVELAQVLRFLQTVRHVKAYEKSLEPPHRLRESRGRHRPRPRGEAARSRPRGNGHRRPRGGRAGPRRLRRRRACTSR